MVTRIWAYITTMPQLSTFISEVLFYAHMRVIFPLDGLSGVALIPPP